MDSVLPLIRHYLLSEILERERGFRDLCDLVNQSLSPYPMS